MAKDSSHSLPRGATRRLSKFFSLSSLAPSTEPKPDSTYTHQTRARDRPNEPETQTHTTTTRTSDSLPTSRASSVYDPTDPSDRLEGPPPPAPLQRTRSVRDTIAQFERNQLLARSHSACDSSSTGSTAPSPRSVLRTRGENETKGASLKPPRSRRRLPALPSMRIQSSKGAALRSSAAASSSNGASAIQVPLSTPPLGKRSAREDDEVMPVASVSKRARLYEAVHAVPPQQTGQSQLRVSAQAAALSTLPPRDSVELDQLALVTAQRDEALAEVKRLRERIGTWAERLRRF